MRRDFNLDRLRVCRSQLCVRRCQAIVKYRREAPADRGYVAKALDTAEPQRQPCSWWRAPAIHPSHVAANAVGVWGRRSLPQVSVRSDRRSRSPTAPGIYAKIRGSYPHICTKSHFFTGRSTGTAAQVPLIVPKGCSGIPSRGDKEDIWPFLRPCGLSAYRHSGPMLRDVRCAARRGFCHDHWD